MKLDLAATFVGLAAFALSTLAAPPASAGPFAALEIGSPALVQSAQARRPAEDEEDEYDEDVFDDDENEEGDVRPLPPRLRENFGIGPESPCEWVRRQVQTAYGSEWRLVQVCGRRTDRRRY